MRLIAMVMVLFVAVTAVQAQELTPSDIEGLKVNVSVTMTMRTRNKGREFAGQTVLQWNVVLGAETAVKGRLVRTYSSGGEVKGRREGNLTPRSAFPRNCPKGQQFGCWKRPSWSD